MAVALQRPGRGPATRRWRAASTPKRPVSFGLWWRVCSMRRAWKPWVDPARALVVPHAGFVFSGPTAAKAFAALPARGVRRVILLGPSHHVSFSGGSLPAVDADRLRHPAREDAPGSGCARRSCARHPLFSGPARAHDAEHSLEVELPFLQVAAPEAQLVPIVVGGETDLDDLHRHGRGAFGSARRGHGGHRLIGLHPPRSALWLVALRRTRSTRDPPGGGALDRGPGRRHGSAGPGQADRGERRHGLRCPTGGSAHRPARPRLRWERVECSM